MGGWGVVVSSDEAIQQWMYILYMYIVYTSSLEKIKGPLFVVTHTCSIMHIHVHVHV